MRLNALELTENGAQMLLDDSGIVRKWYCNNLEGRTALIAEQPPEVVAEVMTIWGDTPTVPDYVPEPTVDPTPAMQIAALKAQLTDTDYQIIKCSECQLVGQPMPYDVAALHSERQVLRDQINEFETISPTMAY